MRLVWINYVLLLVLCTKALKEEGLTKAEIVKNRLKQRKEGSVRLRGGHSPREGNVEIYHKGVWGSVCDDEWDSEDGIVVCQQLGYSVLDRVTNSSQFGNILDDYWMDNVYCSGGESSLSKCRFAGWGIHDCASGESAGVICANDALRQINANTSSSDAILFDAPAVVLKPKIKNVYSLLEIRLHDGRGPNEGRVEIRINASGERLIVIVSKPKQNKLYFSSCWQSVTSYRRETDK